MWDRYGNIGGMLAAYNAGPGRYDEYLAGVRELPRETRDYVAREVSGDERAAWWARAVEAWPDYAQYQTRTERVIPVFVLDPA